MYLLEERIICSGRSDRVEIFPFYDLHGGKRNCAEEAAKKQVKEVLKHSQKPKRHIRAILGGDQLNAISPADVRRFDFNELADWFLVPTPKEIAEAVSSQEIAAIIRAKLSNMVNQEVEHVAQIFDPVKHLILGALTGNHEKSMRTKQNVDVHSAFCNRLNITNLTDEAIIRLTMVRVGENGKPNGTSVVKLYLRHGYGAGRTPGAEPNKLARMLAEWEECDICLSGHSHTFDIMSPKPVARIPNRGKLPKRLFYRYRFAANPGCWLYSHLEGVGSYESMACYPARPMMTLKIVIWPFWNTERDGKGITSPKIELRQYPIL